MSAGRQQQVVEHQRAQVVPVGHPAQRAQPPGLHLAHALQQPAGLPRVAEVLVTVELPEPLQQRVLQPRREQVVVLRGDAGGDEDELAGGVVGELHRLGEPRGETRVGVEELGHLVGVPRDDDRDLVPMVLHQLHQRIDRLPAEVGTGAAGPGQRVRLVDEQDAPQGLLEHRGGLLGGVTDVLTHEIAPGDLLELSVRQHTQRLEQLPVDPRHGGLSGTRCPGEDQVVARVPDAQPRAAPPLVDLDLIDQGADLRLDLGQPDHGVELGEQLLHPRRVLVGLAVAAAVTAHPGGPLAALHDHRRGALVDLDAGWAGVLDRARLDQPAAATPDVDPGTLGGVDEAVAQRWRALQGHRDAHVAGTGDLAVLQGGPAGLVDVHPAVPTPADRGVAYHRVGAEPDDQAVLGDVADVAAVERPARVLDEHALVPTGHGQLGRLDRGAVGDRDPGAVPRGRRTLADAQPAPAYADRRHLTAAQNQPVQRDVGVPGADRGPAVGLGVDRHRAGLAGTLQADPPAVQPQRLGVGTGCDRDDGVVGRDLQRVLDGGVAAVVVRGNGQSARHLLRLVGSGMANFTAGHPVPSVGFGSTSNSWRGALARTGPPGVCTVNAASSLTTGASYSSLTVGVTCSARSRRRSLSSGGRPPGRADGTPPGCAVPPGGRPSTGALAPGWPGGATKFSRQPSAAAARAARALPSRTGALTGGTSAPGWVTQAESPGSAGYPGAVWAGWRSPAGVTGGGSSASARGRARTGGVVPGGAALGAAAVGSARGPR